MANQFNWALGHEGKGNVYDDGSISTWNTDPTRSPHHFEIGQQDEKTPRFHFYIEPNGGLWDGGTSFNNQTPYTDDQVVKSVAEQHPAIWDGRNEFGVDWDADDYMPEERVQMPGGGYGHAEDLLRMGKLASAGWADFHTEFKIPRGIRKQLRRWVDRLKWPENHEKHDAREYHITVLDMDEYDEDFAKWARKEVQGKELTFKSTGMDLFNDFVVVRLECPEWEDLAQRWTEEADKRGLEPHKFPGGPKAHVSVGRSHDKKWPRGVPNPHIKFRTRMFNIKRNSGAQQEWLTNMFGEKLLLEPWEPGYPGKGYVGPKGSRVWKVDTVNDGFPSHSTVFDYADEIPAKEWKEHPTFTVAPDGQMRFHTEENPTRSGYDGWQDALALHPALRPQEEGDTQIPESGYGHAQNIVDILNKQGGGWRESMAIDPEYIQKWHQPSTGWGSQQRYLYHGRQEHPDLVRANGIEGGWSEYHTIPSVYLTSNQGLAEHFAQNPGSEHTYYEEEGEEPEQSQWVYQIDPTKLDPNLIEADEWNVQDPYPEGHEYYGEGHSMTPEMLQHVADPDVTQHQWDLGYPLAYRGTIPPEAIVDHYQMVNGEPQEWDSDLRTAKWHESRDGFFYHTAPSEHRQSIEEHGLIPTLDAPVSPWADLDGPNRKKQPSGVYMWNSPQNARSYAYLLDRRANRDTADRGGYSGDSTLWDPWVFESPEYKNYMNTFTGEPHSEDYYNFEKGFTPPRRPKFDIWKVNTLGYQPQIDPETMNEHGALTPEEAQKQMNAEYAESPSWTKHPMTMVEGHRWLVPHAVEPQRLMLHDEIYPDELTTEQRADQRNQEQLVPRAWSLVPFDQWNEKAQQRYVGDPNVMREIAPQDRTSKWHVSIPVSDEWYEEPRHQRPLYHGTSLANARRILEEGLKPWDDPTVDQKWGNEFEHEWAEPRPGHVYLAQDPSRAQRAAVDIGGQGEYDDDDWDDEAHEDDGKSVVLKVDPRHLNPLNMNPDEDASGKLTENPWDEYDPYFDENAEEPEHKTLGEWAENTGWGDDPAEAEKQIDRYGTMAYRGMIPPEAISVHSILEPEPMAGKYNMTREIWKPTSELPPLSYTMPQQRPITGAVENEPADDLAAWLQSFETTPATQPSPHHTDGDQFAPQVVAPVVQTPHVDPPKKPYKPYNWAEEGWEESPLNMTAKVAMPVDPKFWNQWWTENPQRKYLYHGTTTDRLPAIMQEGLMPWDSGRPAKDYAVEDQARLEPRPNHVYLHEDAELANWYSEQAAKHGSGKPVVLAIDPSRLDTRNINPDEDSWNEHDEPFTGGYPTPHDLYEENINPGESLGGQAENVGYGDNPEHTQWAIQNHGAIAHRGPVPPDAIVGSGDRVQFNPQTQQLELVKQAASADEEMYVPGMAPQPMTINRIGWPQSTAKPGMWNWKPQGHEPARSPFLYNSRTRTIHLGQPGMIHAEMYDAAGVPSSGDVGNEWKQGEIKHWPAELSDKPPWFIYGNPYKPEGSPEHREIYEALQPHYPGLYDEFDAHTAHTHMCPQCGATIDGQICGECGYNPTHPNSDYDSAKNKWYDRAWSHPEDQARPQEPMHWGPADGAHDISLASRRVNGISSTSEGGWRLGSRQEAWRPADDLSPVWHREPNRV